MPVGSYIRQSSTPRRQGCAPKAGARRRGTVMVFVLGILTLLALIGIALVASTQLENRRTSIQTDSLSNEAVIDGVVRAMQETLRADIWPTGAAANNGFQMPLDNSNPPGQPLTNPGNQYGLQENNEPSDQPGVDRWLAPLLPYLLIDPANPDAAFPLQPTQNPPDPFDPASTEANVLAWPSVTYLGTDLLHPQTGTSSNGFLWVQNTRDGTGVPDLVRYDAMSLRNVPILQTPPPAFRPSNGWTGQLIPGSTTNVTIAQAFRIWSDGSTANPFPALYSAGGSPLVPPGLVPQFPYFDTNADGILDLYDADGDGVPDSPISYVISLNPTDPNAKGRLYVIARVVDHSGMLNLNTAFSAGFPNGANGLMFDERYPNLQRRGRRVTELYLDSVAHGGDLQIGVNPFDNRTWRMTDFRTNGTNDPVAFDFNLVRRGLIGGQSDSNLAYFIYGLENEASLRHRGNLVPYEYRDFDKTSRGTGNSSTDYNTVDKALRWSLLWTRGWQNTPAPHSYLSEGARWNRLNSDYSVRLDANNGNDLLYEGFDDPINGHGWRNLVQVDQPSGIRRSMVTTVSHAVEPPPNIAQGLSGFPAGTSRFFYVVRNYLRPNGLDWPLLGIDGFVPIANTPPWLQGSLSAAFANALGVPEHLRPLRVDINMNRAGATNGPAIRADYARYMASALLLSMNGVLKYQGLSLVADDPIPPQLRWTQPGILTVRERLAWQFGLNAADYRDSDDVPSAYTLPGVTNGQQVRVFGVEKQPFFTEAYSRLDVNDETPADPTDDNWFDAVELYIPPLTRLDATKYWVKIIGVPGIGSPDRTIQLTQFQSIDGLNQPLTALDGGGPMAPGAPVGDGAYIVLCSRPGAGATIGSVPPEYNPPPANFYASTNPSQQFVHRHSGSFSRVELIYSDTGLPSDPMYHVIDAIDTRDSMSLPAQTLGARPSGVLNDGDKYVYSMQRSTHGWRFTTAWHDYRMVGTPNLDPPDINSPGTLGRFNAAPPYDPGHLNGSALNALDNVIPESPWPFRSSTSAPGNYAVTNGFISGQPYECFESVADLSRLYIVGNSSPTTATLYGGDITRRHSVPEQLAYIVNSVSGAADLPNAPQERVAAGRIDWANAYAVPATTPGGEDLPWTWRLFNMLTTTSPLFDRVDNDGDTIPDLPNDPTEGLSVVFRAAGRVNVNTAPEPVLRSVPYMSLTPMTPEYRTYLPYSQSPLAEFNGPNQAMFWDFASAIVARREERRNVLQPGNPVVPVPLRLPNGLPNGQVQTVAMATIPTPSAPPAAGGDNDPNRFGYASIPELVRQPNFVGSASSLFQVDRYTNGTGIAMGNHRVLSSDYEAGVNTNPAEPLFSPDFRYRRAEGGVTTDVCDYVPTTPIPGTLLDGDTLDLPTSGGIRGRDIYLSRWSNVLTTRSDVFTVYIALLDENGRYVGRRQVTLDRSECFREDANPPAGGVRIPVLPKVLLSVDVSTTDDSQ